MRTKGKCKRECSPWGASPLETWLQDCIERLYDRLMVRREQAQDVLRDGYLRLGILALVGHVLNWNCLVNKNWPEVTLTLYLVVLAWWIQERKVIR